MDDTYTIELPKKLYTPVHNVIQETEFKNETDALVDFSLIIAMTKLSEFADECNRFRDKYCIDFEDFESRVKKAKKEKFKEWDDYLEWKFAEKGRNHWANRIKELKDASKSP